MEREEASGDWVGDACVALADTIGGGVDLDGELDALIRWTSRLLGTADVGVVIADGRGALRAVGAMGSSSAGLELLELERHEGPCVDCAVTGVAVVSSPLEGDGSTRWPHLAAAGVAAGFRTVTALPLRHGDVVFGALNVFERDGRPVLSERTIRLAQSLADAAGVGIASQRAYRQATELGEQLQRALDERIVIEQAKGMVAEHLGIDPAEAFEVLRRHARSTNRRVSDLAARFVAREIGGADLIG